MKRRKLVRKIIFKTLPILAILGIFGAGLILIWISSLRLPDLDGFEQRKILQSTKIYDKTGEVLLYDVHQDIKRSIVESKDISRYIKNATVAIEDEQFYEHNGIKMTAFIRAVMVNLLKLEFSQGGSTITQQVIKNSFLTQEKKISRKLKEWVLAYKLEKVLTKEEILLIYLNENPYGGNIYGVEEASQAYFSKTAADVSLAEAAYLSALPQAPTYYSPYGKNRDKLDARKNLVLGKMLEHNFISDTEYNSAKDELVNFNSREERGIKAPHFVIYVRDYLINKYGEDAVQENGYKVITTLDYDLQNKAEEIVLKYALKNAENNNAENAALVAVDPQNGQIRVMVGSRNYFDDEIDGNFNIATALRQPGSTFKPFAYAEAFEKGYLPETVVFDTPTEFSTTCSSASVPLSTGANCYNPENYDQVFRGPVSLRNALAQSINVPSVKVLYLAGLKDALNLATRMGIKSLTDISRYGLTLVLGGGEVSLLDITSAYGVFANDGTRFEPTSILSIEDRNGNIIEEWDERGREVLGKNSARMISDILSDNVARTPLYGANSALYFPGYDVAVKTGTTNNYRDVWTLGYTPSIAVGAWAGNNDNTPIAKKISGLVITPMWNEFMQYALTKTSNSSFGDVEYTDSSNFPPIINGFWQGGKTYTIDKTTGKLATEFTPVEVRETKVVQEVHSILHWINKDDPTILSSVNPNDDSQYRLWEPSVRLWASQNGYVDQNNSVIPKEVDDIHNSQSAPKITFVTPDPAINIKKDASVLVDLKIQSTTPISKTEFYLNGQYIGISEKNPKSFLIDLSRLDNVKDTNVLKVVATDTNWNKGTAETIFLVSKE